MKLINLILILFVFYISWCYPKRSQINLSFILQSSMGFMIFFPYIFSGYEYSKQIGFLSFEYSIFLNQFFVLIGILLASSRSKVLKIKDDDENISELKPSRNFLQFWKLLSFFGLIIGILYIFLIPGGINGLPLIKAFQGADNYELMIAREETFKLIDPKWNSGPTSLIFYPLLAYRYIFYPLIVVYFWKVYKYLKKSTKFLGWLVTFMAIFLTIANGQRAPLPAFLIRVTFFYFAFKGIKRTKLIKKFPIFLFLILSIPLFITINNYAEGDIVLGLNLFFNRLTFTPFQDLLDYFNAFPHNWDFLYGDTILKPFKHLLGLDYFYIENEMCFFSNPYSIESCHSNAAYLSNLWADFGYVGVSIGSFLVSYVINLFDNVIVEKKVSFLDDCFYGFLSYTIVVLAFGSVTSVLGTNGGLLCIVYFIGRHTKSSSRIFKGWYSKH